MPGSKSFGAGGKRRQTNAKRAKCPSKFASGNHLSQNGLHRPAADAKDFCSNFLWATTGPQNSSKLFCIPDAYGSASLPQSANAIGCIRTSDNLPSAGIAGSSSSSGRDLLLTPEDILACRRTLRFEHGRFVPSATGSSEDSHHVGEMHPRQFGRSHAPTSGAD